MTTTLLLLLAALTVLSAWLPSHWRPTAATVAILLLVGGGLAGGALAPAALLPLALLFAAAWWATTGRRGRAVAWALFGFTALGIGFGLFPGFQPLVLAETQLLKAGSRPYTLRLDLGKPLVAVAMLLWLVAPTRSVAGWRALLGTALPVTLAAALAVPLLAWAAGHVRPAPGLPPPALTATWMVVNLLFVCTLEEAFFRGLLQRGLGRWMPPPAALALAALLFGLAHFGGGPVYVALATVAGAAYGFAWQLAGGRIEAAILAHFGVNLAHFALYTYPSV